MLWHAQTMLEMSYFSQKIFFTDLTSNRFHETYLTSQFLSAAQARHPDVGFCEARLASFLTMDIVLSHSETFNLQQVFLANCRTYRTRRTTFRRTKRPSEQGTS